MSFPFPPSPLVCVPSAIPLTQRAEHLLLAKRLLKHEAIYTGCIDDGYEVRFPQTSFDSISRFVANERKCCPALRFAIDVAPDDGGITLRLTGPEGAREFIAAELPLKISAGDAADRAKACCG